MEPGKDKAFYDGEIQKIYAATGWDPAKQQYTGKTQPVEWTRIHNMPDFVYFNHSQHVVQVNKRSSILSTKRTLTTKLMLYVKLVTVKLIQ
jgi:hypothetical protein